MFPTLRINDCMMAQGNHQFLSAVNSRDENPHQRSRDAAIKVHQWDDGPLHCDCERQLWKQSATSAGGKESTARIEPGKRPKNAGFELDVDFLWPKRENVKIATMTFRGRLFL